MSLSLTLSLLPRAEAVPFSGRYAGDLDRVAREAAPAGTVQAAAVINDKITFGVSTLRAAKQSGRIVRTSMSKSGKTLNYAKAKKVGGSQKWRRQFVAGF